MTKKSTQVADDLKQGEVGIEPLGTETMPLETDQAVSQDVVSLDAAPTGAELQADGQVSETHVSDDTSMVNRDAEPQNSDLIQPAVMIECAVLLDCIYGKHDDVITLTESEAKHAQAGGYVDTHPNAIKAIRGH